VAAIFLFAPNLEREHRISIFLIVINWILNLGIGRYQPGKLELTFQILSQPATARDISAYDRLSIRAASAKRAPKEMVLGTKYSGAGGATPDRWVLRNRNVMQSNEEGRPAKQQRNDIANQWALGDSRWYHAMIAKGMSKNLAHLETFSKIFDASECKGAFKKPQVIDDFWSQFTTSLKFLIQPQFGVELRSEGRIENLSCTPIMHMLPLQRSHWIF
jgi:hypothetical protein